MKRDIQIDKLHINEPTRVVGTMPQSADAWAYYRVEICTQYSKGGIQLKTPRTTTSRFIIERI